MTVSERFPTFDFFKNDYGRIGKNRVLEMWIFNNLQFKSQKQCTQYMRTFFLVVFCIMRSQSLFKVMLYVFIDDYKIFFRGYFKWFLSKVCIFFKAFFSFSSKIIIEKIFWACPRGFLMLDFSFVVGRVLSKSDRLNPPNQSNFWFAEQIGTVHSEHRESSQDVRLSKTLLRTDINSILAEILGRSPWKYRFPWMCLSNVSISTLCKTFSNPIGFDPLHNLCYYSLRGHYLKKNSK